ncbi:MAG: MBL fold metallo-hydrolase, partial [Thalassolituus sp.]
MHTPTPTIQQVSIAPAGLINAFLLHSGSHTILIDSGLPGTEQKVERALAQHGKTLSDLSLIIITHAHIDHAGNAATLQRLSGARILAHEAERPYLLVEKNMTICATGWMATHFKM